MESMEPTNGYVPRCFMCDKEARKWVFVGGLYAHRKCIYSLGVIEAGGRARKLARSLPGMPPKPEEVQSWG